jgi:hypothetical protein
VGKKGSEIMSSPLRVARVEKARNDSELLLR